MQRIWVLLVAGVLLVACGGAPATTAPPPPAPAAEADDTAVPATEADSAGATSGDAGDPLAEVDPMNDVAASEDAATAPTAAEAAGTDAAAPAAPTAEPPPAGPVTLASGSFNFIDNLHNGTGTAAIVELPDGSRVVRLSDDFFVTEGPGLYVWLGTHPEPVTTNDALNGFIDLGGLQARSGAQEYVIPADIDLTLYQSVIIWCEPFSQVMTSAALQPQ